MVEKLEVLRVEVGLLSEKVNHLGDLRFRCRQMASVLLLAVVGFAVAQGVRWVCLLAPLCPLSFWVTEAYYRRAQQICIERLVAIESHLQEVLREGREERVPAFVVPDAFNVNASGRQRGVPWTDVPRQLLRLTMLLFYVPLVAIPLGAFFVMLFG